MATPLSFTKKFIFTGTKEFQEAEKSSILRFTTVSGLKATAVKLADGTLLEVKRGTAVVKLKFSSVEAWCESVGDDSIRELTLEKKMNKPKQPVTSTRDIDIMREIYKKNMRALHKVNTHIDGGYAWDESERMLREAAEKKDEEMVNRLMEWRKKYHHYSPSYKPAPGMGGISYRAKKEDQIKHYITGYAICYIKDGEALYPLYLCKPSKVFSYWSYDTSDLFQHLYSFPGKSFLYYKAKIGLTFESVGVPLTESGMPNMWAEDCYKKGIGVISKFVFPPSQTVE